jgi:CO dehydrogenase/acetyl-CoA synthase beta subunit
MALFEEQLTEVRNLLEAWRGSGSARDFDCAGREPWPDGPSLVLEEETAIELGNPSVASISMLLWSESGGVEDGTVTLVGSDVAEAAGGSLPFGQVVIAGGRFPDEYESYRDVRDAVYDTRLEGFSVRTMPSRQSVWCRVSRDAAGRGFSLVDLGAALIDSLKGLDEVSEAQVVFVTAGVDEVKKLAGAAAGAQRIVDAMMKMYQEENFDCETCEYQDVCDTVMDLKKIRQKLAEGMGTG